MRIAVVGPGDPQKGGVALHTTDLVRRLAATGDDVAHVGWRHPYPGLLYPGRITVDGAPELASPIPVQPLLDWYDPVGWRRAGRAAGRADLAVVVHVTPAQGPALAAVVRHCADGRARTVVVAHNVVPHESRPGDRALTRSVLHRADVVVVHGEAEAAAARRLTDAAVRVRPLPATLPDAVAAAGPQPPRAHDGELRVVVPGLVRPYKGVDVLVRALAFAPRVRVRVAGEFWGGTEELAGLAAAVGVSDRISFEPGYVPADRLPGLLGWGDVVALPYRSSTGSQNALLARALGRPVLATRVPAFAADVRDDVDGLLVAPDDPQALGAALVRLGDAGLLARLTSAAASRGATEDAGWDAYLTAVTQPAG
ncbi:MAG TPA: glycosyltransferase [Candidatus Nanopelagicales bacterium]|nr:glycosyltransferase [Candidatus Nanopelagicales bacterium]